MKKKKLLHVLIWICGLIILQVGVFLLAFSIGLQNTDSSKLLLKIPGALAFFVGLLLLMYGFFKHFNGNKLLEIAEKDERNIAIRGKAAQLTCLVTSFLLLAVIIAFVFMELLVASLIIGIVMLISSFLQMILIGYYDKKGSMVNEDSEDLK